MACRIEEQEDRPTRVSVHGNWDCLTIFTRHDELGFRYIFVIITLGMSPILSILLSNLIPLLIMLPNYTIHSLK